ncbi:hypothetical protein L6164_025550 [Bauhinia variegata]|uniref:Uncharacterized protein n=1 Tax=Bauhinia variegata TaxID=167791 RepID=A0ACB9M1Q5_BAUVA|nr:hypothetical protein L6164_025550 [Bauhinia variegata]
MLLNYTDPLEEKKKKLAFLGWHHSSGLNDGRECKSELGKESSTGRLVCDCHLRCRVENIVEVVTGQLRRLEHSDS